MSKVRDARKVLVAASRRHSRIVHEAEDVAHDIILSALRRGLPLDGETFARTSHGSARRHAAFLARCASRRRAREEQVGESVSGGDAGAPPTDATEGHPLSVLSPALRTTLFLLLLGLDKAELRAVLGVTDAALRKRFQALRAYAPLDRPTLHASKRTQALSQLRRSHVELLPRFALASRNRGGRPPRILALGDPDGHGIILAETLTNCRAAATSGRKSCSTLKSRTSPSYSS